MLTRSDETELLLPLQEGLYEQPRWAGFLARLKRRTTADYAALLFRQGDAPMHEATELFSGRDVRAAARLLTPGALYRLDPTPYNALRPGRVYSADDMIDPQDADQSWFRHDYLEKVGLRHGRYVRVTEPGGASAWAVLNRQSHDFDAADSMLLSALAPHIALALRHFANFERDRLRAAIAGDALRRNGVGWIVLDNGARLIDADATGLRLIGAATKMPQSLGARLRLPLASADRSVAQASAAFAADAAAAPRLLRLSDHPRLELLAVPAVDQPLVALSMSALFGYVREGRPMGGSSATILVAAYGLSMGEARLALALCDGRTIAEAGSSVGLTIETARNYSKRIYAKTGTRGQVDLVRLIMSSVVGFAT